MNPADRPLVVIAAAEAVPWVKVGGLADVVGALFTGLRERFSVALFLPWYQSVRDTMPTRVKWEGKIAAGNGATEECRVAESVEHPGLFLISHEGFFGRPFVYGPAGKDYPDSVRRFAFFSRAVLEACRGMGLQARCFHCHDWHTALLPVYLKHLYGSAFSSASTVLTIHNLAHQGVAPAEEFPSLGLPQSCWSIEGLEFYGQVNLLKGGILDADRVTTVSERYAREILTPEFGCGLEGVLSRRRDVLTGIRNGVDYRIWNPRVDSFIARRYSTCAGKRFNRASLLELFGLKLGGSGPVFGFVGRLVEQKGVDLVVSVLERIAASGGQAVILGEGTPEHESQCVEACRRLPGAAAARIAFDEALAHAVYAGSDIFLMPSRFEPCGIGQMIAMKYGTVPLATRVGGLADTVRDVDEDGWGITCEPTPDSLASAVDRCFRLFSARDIWEKMVRRVMALDFSWRKPLEEYARLISSLVDGGS